MRELLAHEHRLTQLLLSRNPGCNCVMPDVVTGVFFPCNSKARNITHINSAFTLFFQNEPATRNLERVASHAALPGLTEATLFLVRDAASNRLAFLELIAACNAPITSIVQYLVPVTTYCRENISSGTMKSCTAMLSALGTKRPHGTVRQATGMLDYPSYLRLIVLGDSICFFIAETKDLVIDPPSPVSSITSDRGAVNVLHSPAGNVAIDGWLIWDEA